MKTLSAISFNGTGARIWYRYVDDTFVVVKESEKAEFFEHLNEVDVNIKFTEECSSNNKLAFLDCLIQREVDGSFSTSVYRKPTHTDHYLLFESNDPLIHKLGVIRSCTISSYRNSVQL